jgi:molybdenum cofactor biosynthesis enzyme MoaA
VGFGGGEPMLHPALPELCEFVTKNTRLAVTITTHGHRITESLAAQLKGNVNFIRVSVDSVGHNYELIRGRSFHQLKEKLDLIRAVSPFGINCVVNSTTVDALHSVAEFAANEGAIELLLIPQHRTKTVSEAEKATIDALHMWIEAYRGTIQLSISEEAAGALPIHMDRTGDNGILSYAHIDAEGRLKRTSYDSLGVPIGERAVLETLDALVRITR